eukprot:TRINITY_DN7409_c0_g1_i3.p1 TRINITY_DN7409_c0_g1~~TRINITY_DN7409_c0_g1_i3.p1  ORF type:complete len:289 (+),score=25.76 TRINITY_DN7409_c0_g1_i3:311-1177(+)
MNIQKGDLILTSTPSMMYEHMRQAMGVRYDHLAVAIDQDSIIHISPPKVRIVQSNVFLMKKRSPLILRVNTSLENKELFVEQMLKHLGHDYDYGRATTMIFSLLCDRSIFRSENSNKSQALEYLIDPGTICTDLIAFHLYKTCPEFVDDLKVLFNKLYFNRVHSFAPDDFHTLAMNGKSFEVIYQEKEYRIKRMNLDIMNSNMMTGMRYWYYSLKGSGKLGLPERQQWLKYLEVMYLLLQIKESLKTPKKSVRTREIIGQLLTKLISLIVAYNVGTTNWTNRLPRPSL